MADEPTLLNGALGMIGANPITSIDDGSINAEHCKVFYPDLRDGLLRSHRWNFAEDRAELVQLVATPLFGFAFQYALPADFLALREYFGGATTTTVQSLNILTEPSPRYRLEKNKLLLSNDAIVRIVYTKRETNPDLWDPLFYQMTMTWLASQLAMAITKDAKKARELLEMAVNILQPFATAVDGQENPIQPYISDSLLRGR